MEAITVRPTGPFHDLYRTLRLPGCPANPRVAAVAGVEGTHARHGFHVQVLLAHGFLDTSLGLRGVA